MAADELPAFPLRFCRHCGQEYYHVLFRGNRFLPVTATDVLSAYEERPQEGYLMLVPSPDWSEEQLPAEWRDANGQVSNTWRDRIPKPVWVRPDGTCSTENDPEAIKMWWQPRPFTLCLSCGEFYDKRVDEFTKLGGLSSEGRSSATTVLALALLRYAKQTAAARDKLLTFTDNRQDASLQAGHFNDFVQVALLRSALCAALREHGELRAHDAAAALVEHCGLTLRDYAANPELDAQSKAAYDAKQTLTEVMEYRLYEDLRLGWRFTCPNLEQVGLLRIDYLGLAECCANEALWRADPALSALARLSPATRQELLSAILDEFRRQLAINAPLLQREEQDKLRKKARQNLNPFWGLDPDETLREARAGYWLSNKNGFALSTRSLIGRYLLRELKLTVAEYDVLMPALLNLLVRQGILCRVSQDGYQLDAGALIWRRGYGRPQRDRLRERTNLPLDAQEVNRYFQQLYQLSAAELTALEAREHTAQVVAAGEREVRERRFRWEESDRDKLGRRLPYLVCSPTMELGVDIADLDIVHLRNVPPTPANYAQRSGRAGRQGQPGLIVTYCSAYSHHDQYFFGNQAEMVAGSVRAPRLDPSSQSLLRTHVHAIWLAEVGLPLGSSIAEVLGSSIAEVIETEADPNGLPLKENVRAQITLPVSRKTHVKQKAKRVLADVADQLPVWWLDEVIDQAAQQFDRAFDRWREMYRVAKTQLHQAREEGDRTRDKQKRGSAEQREREAKRQLNLLLQKDVQPEESDFYPYRYLACEDFLPGYNFPALPVRAWVPRGTEGEFLSQPRFLAIREFALQNIIYHEGAKWEVVALQPPPGGLDSLKVRMKICMRCGAFNAPDLDICLCCGAVLDGATSKFVTALEMPNVRARRRERITSDEEERRRRGYRVEVSYSFSEGVVPVKADIVKDDQSLLSATYAPATELRLINYGWRHGEGGEGFLIDLASGEAVDADACGYSVAQASCTPERLCLMTRNTQNVLLLRPVQRLDEATLLSLSYALRIGIGQVFQLEESELAVEIVGQGEWQSTLLHENAEGSIGVLARLVDEPGVIARVAAEALPLCHFDAQGNDQKPDCQRACYQCLLSYDNQHVALSLNRHLIRDLLIALSRARTLRRVNDQPYHVHLQRLLAQTDPRSELERRYLRWLAAEGRRLPDAAQYRVDDPPCVADFFYEPRTLVFCDGTPHDDPAQRQRDDEIRQALKEKGYIVKVIHYDALGSDALTG